MGLNEENAMYYAEKKKVQEQLKELSEARTQQTGDLPDLIKKREELSTQIQAKIKDRNAIRGERKEAEQAHRAYLAEVRELRQERLAEERKQAQKDSELRQK